MIFSIITLLVTVVLAVGMIYLFFISTDVKFQVLRMCVASIGCFGGLAAIIHGVDKNEDAIIPGVVVAGLALAVLLRIISQLIAAEINKAKQGSDGPS